MLNLPRLCQALGNDLLIKWQAAQYEAGAVTHAAPALPPSALLRETVTSAAELGDLARAVEAALSDDTLTRRERMAIRREAQELASRLLNIVNGVSAGL
jgi:ribosomal protein L32E